MAADEPDHRIRHGIPYVRASTVVKQLDKPALVGWAARVTAERAFATAKDWYGSTDPREAIIDRLKSAPFDDSNAKAETGTTAHALVDVARDGIIPADVPKEAAGHLRQWLQFVREWNVDVLASELTLYHDDLLYSGRFDLLAIIPRFGLLIVDVKTGKNVYPEAALQLTGYLRSTTVVWPDGTESDWQEVVSDAGGAVLHLRPRSHGLRQVRTDDVMWAMFRRLLDIYQMRPILAESIGPKLTSPDEAVTLPW